MEALIEIMTAMVAIVGALAFCVSVITEVFKGVSVLNKMPTDILVLVLSIGLTVTSYIAYMQYAGKPMLWYMVLASVIAGFVVAFIAMYGWEKLSELWKRFGNKDVRKNRNSI